MTEVGFAEFRLALNTTLFDAGAAKVQTRASQLAGNVEEQLSSASALGSSAIVANFANAIAQLEARSRSAKIELISAQDISQLKASLNTATAAIADSFAAATRGADVGRELGRSLERGLQIGIEAAQRLDAQLESIEQGNVSTLIDQDAIRQISQAGTQLRQLAASVNDLSDRSVSLSTDEARAQILRLSEQIARLGDVDVSSFQGIGAALQAASDDTRSLGDSIAAIAASADDIDLSVVPEDELRKIEQAAELVRRLKAEAERQTKAQPFIDPKEIERLKRELEQLDLSGVTTQFAAIGDRLRDDIRKSGQDFEASLRKVIKALQGVAEDIAKASGTSKTTLGQGLLGVARKVGETIAKPLIGAAKIAGIGTAAAAGSIGGGLLLARSTGIGRLASGASNLTSGGLDAAGGFLKNVNFLNVGFVDRIGDSLQGGAANITSFQSGVTQLTDQLEAAQQAAQGFGAEVFDVLQAGVQNAQQLAEGFSNLPPELQAIAVASLAAGGAITTALGAKALKGTKDFAERGLAEVELAIDKLFKRQESLVKQQAGLASKRAFISTIQDPEERIEQERIQAIAEAKFSARRDDLQADAARSRGEISASDRFKIKEQRDAQLGFEIEAINQRAAKALEELQKQTEATERSSVEAGLAAARGIEAIGIAAEESAAKVQALQAKTSQDRIAAAARQRDVSLRRSRFDEESAIAGVQRDATAGNLNADQAEQAIAGIRARFESERQQIEAGFTQLVEATSARSRQAFEAVAQELRALEIDNLSQQVQLASPEEAIALREQIALKRNALDLDKQIAAINQRQQSGDVNDEQARKLKLAAVEAKRLADELARRDSVEAQKEIARTQEDKRRAVIATTTALNEQLRSAQEQLAAAQAANGTDADKERLIVLRQQNELRAIQVAFLERQQQILDRLNAGEITVEDASNQTRLSRGIRDTQTQAVNVGAEQQIQDLQQARLQSTVRTKQALEQIGQQIKEQVLLQQQAAGIDATQLASLQRENQLQAESLRLAGAIAQIEQDRNLTAQQRVELIAAERQLSAANQATINAQAAQAIAQAVKGEEEKAIAAKRTLEDLQLQLEVEQALVGRSAEEIGNRRKAAEIRRVELEAARQIQDVQRAIADGSVSADIGGEQIAIIEQLKNFKIDSIEKDLAAFADRLREIEQQGAGAAISINAVRDAAETLQAEGLRIQSQRTEVAGDRRSAIELERQAALIEEQIRLRQQLAAIAEKTGISEEVLAREAEQATANSAQRQLLIQEEAERRITEITNEEIRKRTEARERAQSRLKQIEESRLREIKDQEQRNRAARDEIGGNAIDLREQQAALALRRVLSDPRSTTQQRTAAIDANALRRSQIEAQKLNREIAQIRARQIDPIAERALIRQAQRYNEIRLEIIKAEAAEQKRQATLGDGGGDSFLGGLIGGAVSGVVSDFVTSLSSLPQTFLQVGGQAEQARATLELFTGSAERAQAVYEQLALLAANTPLGLNSINEVNNNLISYGLGIEEAIDTTRRLADVTRGQDEAFRRISITLGQVISLNKLQGDNLREFQAAGIPILQALQEVTGKSAEEIQNLISGGGVDASLTLQALRSLTDEGGKFFGLAEAQSQTFLGQVSTFIDTFQQRLVGIFDQISPQLKDVLGQATILLESFLGSPVLAVGIGAFQGLLAAIGAIPPELVTVAGGFTALAVAIALAAAAQASFSAAVSTEFFAKLAANVGDTVKVLSALATTNLGALSLNFAGVGAAATKAGVAIKAFATGAVAASLGLLAAFAAAILSVQAAFDSLLLVTGNAGFNFEDFKKELADIDAEFQKVTGSAQNARKELDKPGFNFVGAAQAQGRGDQAIIDIEALANGRDSIAGYNEELIALQRQLAELKKGGTDAAFEQDASEIENRIARLKAQSAALDKIANSQGNLSRRQQEAKALAQQEKAAIDERVKASEELLEQLRKERVAAVDNRTEVQKLTDALTEQIKAIEFRGRAKGLDIDELLATKQISEREAAFRKAALAIETAEERLKALREQERGLRQLQEQGKVSGGNEEFVQRSKEIADAIKETELDLRQAQIERINTVNEQDKKTKEEQKNRILEQIRLTKELVDAANEVASGRLNLFTERLDQLANLANTIQQLSQAQTEVATSALDLRITRLKELQEKANQSGNQGRSRAIQEEINRLEEQRAKVQLQALVDAQQAEQRILEIKNQQLVTQQRIAEQQAQAALIEAKAGKAELQAQGASPERIKLAEQLIGIRQQGLDQTVAQRPLLEEQIKNSRALLDAQGQTRLNQLLAQNPSLSSLDGQTLKDIVNNQIKAQQQFAADQRFNLEQINAIRSQLAQQGITLGPTESELRARESGGQQPISTLPERALQANPDSLQQLNGLPTPEQFGQSLSQSLSQPITTLAQSSQTFAQTAQTFAQSIQQMPQVGAPLQQANNSSQQAGAAFIEAARTMTSAVNAFSSATQTYASASNELVRGFSGAIGAFFTAVQQFAGAGGGSNPPPRSATLPAAGVF